jgi:hypothetical protein
MGKFPGKTSALVSIWSLTFTQCKSQEWVKLYLYPPYMPLWHGQGLNLYLYHLNVYLCLHKAPTPPSFPTFLTSAWPFPPLFVTFNQLHFQHLPFIFMLTTLFRILSLYILKLYKHQTIQSLICLSKYISFNFLSYLVPYSPSSGSSSYDSYISHFSCTESTDILPWSRSLSLISMFIKAFTVF